MTGLVTAYRTFQVGCRYGHVNFFVSTSMASHCHVTSLMTWSGLEPNLDFEIARLCTHVLISQRRKIYC
ncbi:unnamed protein product [Rhizophagus irregularis]|nr:unnamed protein product [Rhizophagus irregularis]